MKSKITYISASVLLLCVGFIFLHFSTSDPDTSLQKKQEQPYSIQVTQLYIPETLSLFGEQVPIQNFDTRESLERELLVNVFWQSQTTMFIKMVGRYFSIIEEVLQRYNIPDDFKYLALAESGFRHNVSPAGATGYWQFLDKTAKEFGLTVTDQIDERYHLEKATEAACRYFLQAYERFGNWTLVAASYNVGMAGLRRQLEYQHISSYYDMHTNSETGRYVFRIMALKLILENPETYGYYVSEQEKYAAPSYKTLAIDTAIPDLAKFALEQGSNYKLLRIMNPWIRSRSSLPAPRQEPYLIKIVELSERESI